jgi:hypothetical protein
MVEERGSIEQSGQVARESRLEAWIGMVGDSIGHISSIDGQPGQLEGL